MTGPSGSGKSTALQLIGGLEEVTNGQAVVDGQDLAKLSGEQLARMRYKDMGIIFQNFYLDPKLSLRQNIELAGILDGTPEPERKKKNMGIGWLNYLGSSSFDWRSINFMMSLCL